MEDALRHGGQNSVRDPLRRTRAAALTLSLTDARRLALRAQGFCEPRPAGGPAATHIRDAIRRLGLLQLDFVNVLAPAHYLVLFSRLGPFDRALFHKAVYESGDFTEQWAHEASIIPMDLWPLLRHRMESFRVRPYFIEKFLAGNPEYVRRVLDEVRARGPLGAEQIAAPDGTEQLMAQAWFRSVSRAVLEAHFARGRLAVLSRRPNFSRVYDLAERVIPDRNRLPAVAREDAQREVLRRAAQACGVGTAGDLADYYRMPIRDARERLAELESARAIEKVSVEGWREPAYLYAGAGAPKSADAARLLSPFDPLVWHRPRALRLFHFDYRIEIYTPESRRKWGYYVLPFLFGDTLAARLDLKADRTARRLVVCAAYAEAGCRADVVAAALAEELRLAARWLELDSVSVEKKGNLAKALASCLAASRARPTPQGRRPRRPGRARVDSG